MTHTPLRAVPEGCVNVYGHLHQGRMAGDTWHITVSVEQVHYQPRPLTDIRRLTVRLDGGGAVRGSTTPHQLVHVVDAPPGRRPSRSSARPAVEVVRPFSR